MYRGTLVQTDTFSLPVQCIYNTSILGGFERVTLVWKVPACSSVSNQNRVSLLYRLRTLMRMDTCLRRQESWSSTSMHFQVHNTLAHTVVLMHADHMRASWSLLCIDGMRSLRPLAQMGLVAQSGTEVRDLSQGRRRCRRCGRSTTGSRPTRREQSCSKCCIEAAPCARWHTHSSSIRPPMIPCFRWALLVRA